MLGLALSLLILCFLLPVRGMLQLFMVFHLAMLLACLWLSAAITSVDTSALVLGSDTSPSLTSTQRSRLHFSRLQFLSSLIPKLPALKSKETPKLQTSLAHTAECVPAARCCCALGDDTFKADLLPGLQRAGLLLSTRMLLPIWVRAEDNTHW